METNTAGTTVDITSSLPACLLTAVYVLKSDKTATYTESGSCTGTDNSGSWDVVSNKLTIDAGSITLIDDIPVTSWNCSTLVVTETVTVSGITASTIYTLTKQ
jgi:hypothetical protein